MYEHGHHHSGGADEPRQPEGHVSATLHCVACAYDLAGLPASGACPECGTGVQRSIDAAGSGFRLELSSKDHVSTLLGGARLVLTGILLMVSLLIVSVVIAASGFTWGLTSSLLSVGQLAFSLMIAAGWWKLSEPDPALSRGYDGGKPRKVVRVCVLISVVTSGVDLLANVVVSTGLAASIASIALLGMTVLNVAASIVAFFAQMLYLRWLAPRLPNHAAAKRAKTMLWLGPVLYTVGLLALGLGPLVALVLYYNLLDKIRKDLNRIVSL